MDAAAIVQEIENHLAFCNGVYHKNYCVGITDDPEEKLFSKHGIDKDEGCWIYLKASSTEEAKKAEVEMESRGMKVCYCDEGETNQFVYCYRIVKQKVESETE